MSKVDAANADRGWTPVRNGIIYCSPRCGYKCTWAEHQAAVHDAEALCRRLGDGWQPCVWENGRWHYAARKGACTVHPSIRWEQPDVVVNGRGGVPVLTGYTAFFNTLPQALGEHQDDPLEAVREALELAQDRILEAERDIGELLV